MLHGTTALGDYDCPFCYVEGTEKITLYLGDKWITFPEGTDEIIGQKLGVMAGDIYYIN